MLPQVRNDDARHAPRYDDARCHCERSAAIQGEGLPRLDCFTNGKLLTATMLPRVHNDDARHAARNDGPVIASRPLGRAKQSKGNAPRPKHDILHFQLSIFHSRSAYPTVILPIKRYTIDMLFSRSTIPPALKRFLCFASVLFVVIMEVWGVDYTWTGAISSDWDNPLNWNETLTSTPGAYYPGEVLLTDEATIVAATNNPAGANVTLAELIIEDGTLNLGAAITLKTTIFTDSGSGGEIFSSGGTIEVTGGGFATSDTVLNGTGITLKATNGNINVENATIGGNVTLNAGINAVTFKTTNSSGLTVISLTANGAVTIENAGGNLTVPTVSTSGVVSLTASGMVTTAAGGTTGGGITIEGASLTLNGDINAGMGSVGLKATSDAVSTTSVITANVLTVSANTGIALTASNKVSSINFTNTTGGVSFTNSNPLTITSVDNGSGTVSIENSGNIAITLVDNGSDAVSITSTTGNITQTGGISGGATTLTGAAITLSQTNTLGSLMVVNSGTFTLSAALTLSGYFSQTGAGTNSIGASITATTIAFAKAVKLTAGVTFTTNAGGVTFTETVNGTTAGAQSLIIDNGSGTVTFGDAVGTTATPLLSLDVQGTTGTINLRNVTTSGMQRFVGPVTLAGNTTLTTTGGNVSLGAVTDNVNTYSLTITSGPGDVTLGDMGTSATDALGAITITSTGTKTWDGAVYAASVMQTGAGENKVNANITATAGGVSLVGLVKLGNNVVVATSLANGAVTFSGTINSDATATPRTLTVTAGSGAITFGGVVGGTAALASMSATSSSGISIKSVTTSGGQTYTGPVTLADTTTLTSSASGAVTFSGTINSDTTPRTLTVTAGSGPITFGGVVGGTAALASMSATSSGGISIKSVTTSGGQTYTGPVTLADTTTLKTNNSGITFSGTVNGTTAGAQSLTIDNGGGTVTFGGVVGGGPALSSLDVQGTGTIYLRNVTTSGTQKFGGPVTLAANTTLTTTSGDITFSKTVNGTTAGVQSLTIVAGTGNNVIFDGEVGDAMAFSAFTITSGNVTANYNVTVTGELKIDGGTLTGASGKIIRVGGNWTNNVGTTGFVPSGGTVTMTGTNQTVTGDNTFYAFTITNTGTTAFTGANTFASFSCTIANKTIQFEAANTFGNFSCTGGGQTIKFAGGTTQTVNGTFTFRGTLANRNTLTGTGLGYWTLAAGTVTTNYAIQYTEISEGIAGTFIGWTSDAANDPWNIDGGNTANFFSGFTWSGNGTSDAWDEADNWSMGMVPPNDSKVKITIPNLSVPSLYYPKLVDDVTAKTITVNAGAEVDLAGYDVTATIDNWGTVKLLGTETFPLPGTRINQPGSTVEYHGTGAVGPVLAWGNTYENLVISMTGGSWTASSAITVDETLSNPSGANAAITFNANLTVSGTAEFHTTGLLVLNGTTGTTSSFNGGLTRTGGSTQIKGIVQSATSGMSIEFGAVTLSANATVSTINGAVTLGTVTGTSTLTITSDGGTISTTATTGIYATAVTVQRATSGSISIGNTVVSGVTMIKPDFLQKISTGTVTIGDNTNTSGITVDVATDLSGTDYDLDLVGNNAANVTFNAALTLEDTKTLTIDVGGDVTGTSGALVTAEILSITKAANIGAWDLTDPLLPPPAPLYTAIGTLSGAGLSLSTLSKVIIDNNGNLLLDQQIGTNTTPINTVYIEVHSTITQNAPISALYAYFYATTGIALNHDNNITYTFLKNEGGSPTAGIEFTNKYTRSNPVYPLVAAKNAADGGSITIKETGPNKDLALGDLPFSLGSGIQSNGGEISVTATASGRSILLESRATGTPYNVAVSSVDGAGGAAITFGSPIRATYGGTDSKRETLTVTAGTGNDIIFGGAVGNSVYLDGLNIASGTVKNDVAGGPAPALSIRANKLTLGSGAKIDTSAPTNYNITLKIDDLKLYSGGNAISAGDFGTITIAPNTPGKTIEFGDNETYLGDFYYSSRWNNITAAAFTIGDNNTSTIYISETGQNPTVFGTSGVPYAVEFVTGTFSGVGANIEIRGDYKSADKTLTLSPAGAGRVLFNSTSTSTPGVTVDLGAAAFTVLNNVVLAANSAQITTITAEDGINFGSVAPDPVKTVNISSQSAYNSLTLNAGTAGNILFNGTIGSISGSFINIGSLTINTAANVTFNNTVAATGAVSITHTGMLTTKAAITANGGWTQDAPSIPTATNNIGGNITTSNNDIAFNRPIEITHATGITLNSGTGGGNISFTTVTGAGRNFTVTAGTGAVTISDDIGGDGITPNAARLGAVSVTGTGITLGTGASIYTNNAHITLNAGAGTTLSAGTEDLTLDVGSGGTPTITLIADTVTAGTLELTGTATLRRTGSGNIAIDANVTLTETTNITLALTNSATSVIQANGKKLTLADGATLDLAAYNWLVGDDDTNHLGFRVNSTSGLDAHTNSTLAMSGTGKTLTLLSVSGQTLGNLTISNNNPSGNMVTLGADLTLKGNMTLHSNGTNYALSAGTFDIEIGGNWTQTNQSDFDPNGKTVTFTDPSPGNRTATIQGKTNWYNLTLTWAKGLSKVQFSNLAVGATAMGNGHKVSNKLLIAGNSSTELLSITRLTDSVTPPNVPPDEPDERWWVFENEPEFVLDGSSKYYDVRYSWATKEVKTIDPDPTQYHLVAPYYWPSSPSESRYNNSHWLLSEPFLYSFTEDSDGNGRIDRIRAQAANFISVEVPYAFSGFSVNLTGGYEVDAGKGINGYAFVRPPYNATTYDDMIYIYLKEKDYPDTDARPSWSVVNSSLYTGDYTLLGTPSEDPIDTAPPRISYTLAVPGDNKVYVRMSESVLASGTGGLDQMSGTFAGRNISGVTSINPVDNYTAEFYLVLDDVIPADTIVSGTAFPVDAFDGLVDRLWTTNKIPSRPTGVTQSPKFPKQYPGSFVLSPPFNFTYVEIDNSTPSALNPTSFRTLVTDIQTEIPNRFNANSPDYGTTNRDQRASDILIMVEPDPSLGLSDPHLSIWPLRMRDTANALVDADNAVIGRIERYDGRGRLRPPLIETEFIADKDPTDLTGAIENLGLYFSALSEFGGYKFTAAQGDRINLPQVMNGLRNAPGVWLPDSTEPQKPANYKDLRWFFMPSARVYADHAYLPEPSAKAFTLAGSGQNLPMKEIVYVLSPTSGTNGPLYGLWLDTWTSGDTTYTFPPEWWTRDRGTHQFLKPFNLTSFGITRQVSGVTILNNVIDPTKKEHTVLAYTLTRRGRVTINVFTLDGTQVRRLVSEVRDPGDYEAIWEGTNQNGRPVARGMYFIRVVAPDIDEFRKVMVVK
jgi:hypothetical protein